MRRLVLPALLVLVVALVTGALARPAIELLQLALLGVVLMLVGARLRVLALRRDAAARFGPTTAR